MKKKMSPHIIAAGAFVVFIVLGLACASTPQPTIQEKKESWIKPENNKFKIERSMAIKNVPINEQCFIFLDPAMEVKDKIFSTYKGDLFNMSMTVIPVDSNRLWARYNNQAEMEITFTTEAIPILSFIAGQKNLEAPSLKAGQFYWLLRPTWINAGYKKTAFLILPLNDEGIEIFTKNTWEMQKNKELFQLGFVDFTNKDDWSSYEEYHDFVKQIWEIRKEEARKQF
jgi:hypothetical protein